MSGLGRFYLCEQDPHRPGAFECVVGDDRKPKRPKCDPLCGQYQQPEGYIAASDWADEMMVGHDQEQCPGCGTWSIWRPAPPLAVGQEIEGMRAVASPVGTVLRAQGAAVVAIRTVNGWSLSGRVEGPDTNAEHYVRINQWVVLETADGDHPAR